MAGSSRTSKMAGRLAVIATCAGALALLGLVGCSDEGDSTTVPAPEAEDAQETVAELVRAYDAHGICYGWRLTDRSRVVSEGSNLGVNVPASADQSRCARRVELHANVHYTPETSEEMDSVTYRITTAGVPNGSRFTTDTLDRLKVGGDELLDEPGDAILAGVRLLPLLAVEAGAASVPVPTASASPAATAGSVPAGGSDFWRNRWSLLLFATALLGLAVGALVRGRILARRQAEERARRKAKARKAAARRKAATNRAEPAEDADGAEPAEDTEPTGGGRDAEPTGGGGDAEPEAGQSGDAKQR